ncbi:MAG: DUF1080 domain-containing protein, partial [Bacteroidota bacterium]
MKSSLWYFTLLISCYITTRADAQIKTPLEGRWDLTITKNGQQLPSWLEVRHSGNNTLVGRFVYAFGSARPIAEVKLKDGKFYFSIPPQWEKGERWMDFEGSLENDNIIN